MSETLNHWYLVSAHVIEDGYREEKFMSLSYAGFLPGYTMGYNHHGLIFTINTLSAATLRSGKTRKGIIRIQCFDILRIKCDRQKINNL